MKKMIDVAPKGNELETLKVLRDRLAAAIDETDSARDIAALSRQMTDVLERIEEVKSRDNTTNISSLESIRSRFKVAE